MLMLRMISSRCCLTNMDKDFKRMDSGFDNGVAMPINEERIPCPCHSVERGCYPHQLK